MDVQPDTESIVVRVGQTYEHAGSIVTILAEPFEYDGRQWAAVDDWAMTAPVVIETVRLEHATERDTPGVKANKLGGFQRDSETSRRAAIDNYPRSGSQRHRALVDVAKAGDHGRTRHEIADNLGLVINSATARVSELLQGGWVVQDAARTRPTSTGSEAAVLILTDRGRAYIIENVLLGDVLSWYEVKRATMQVRNGGCQFQCDDDTIMSVPLDKIIAVRRKIEPAKAPARRAKRPPRKTARAKK